MTQLVADYTLERLSRWGVTHIFGYPGDGINGLIGAMRRHGDELQFVQPRHEEMAAFMACAYAKWTRRVGVCMATSGPGAIHLLNGLYDALKDHQPVLAIVGQQKRISLGADYQQEVDLPVLFKDVASQFCHMCTQPAQMRQLIDRALRISLAERTVTCIIVPNDVQEMPAEDAPDREHGAVFTGVGYEAPRIVPRAEQLERAARVLTKANGSRCSSARALWMPPRRCSSARTASAPASPRHCSAGRQCRMICRMSREPSACSAPMPATT